MINFDDVPKVALEFMNADHEEATKITNTLQTLIGAADNGEANPQAISDTLEKLLIHCREHFAREEAQMQKINFPPYPIHQGEHQCVLNEMEQVLEDWRKSEDLVALKQYAFDTLPEWFIGHIESMDSITALFIARCGGPFESE